MRQSLAPAILLLLSVLLMAASALADRSAAPIMGPEELRRGMRGHGLTVLRGETPERFDVEVIGVLEGFRPNQGLILIRTPHPLLDRARAVGGMSGSPIFIDDRLIGAYAYGWPYGAEPVVGVTPIRNMLLEMRRPIRPDAFPGAEPLSERAHGRTDAAQIVRDPPLLFPAVGETGPLPGALTAIRAIRAREEPRGAAPSGPVPVATPVMLGGFHDDVADMLREELRPWGLEPVQASAGSDLDEGAPAVGAVPGGSMAVALVTGDMTTAAVGTITHVDAGGRVVAFGHPMINQGQTGMPTTHARILHVFVSHQRSMKIGEATAPLGTLIHDRQSGIVIDRGLRPATVPFTVRIHGAPDAPKTEWRVRLAGHRALTPALAFATLSSAIKATISDRTHGAFHAMARVDIEGLGEVTVEDRGAFGSGPGNPAPFQRLRLFALMEAAYGNPFEESRIRSARVDLHFDLGHHTLSIEDASVPGVEVDPGTSLPVRVRLRRFGGPDRFVTMQVPIPHSAAGEEVKIHIEAAPEAPRERGPAQSLEQLVRYVEEHRSPTALAISLELPSRGLRFPGHAVQELPASALSALRQGSSSAPTRPFASHRETFLELGEVVEGSTTLEVEVRRAPRRAPTR